MSNILEFAIRNKLRFPSTKGELTIEQLWDVPLRAPNSDFHLDNIAKAVNRQLKDAEPSFVETAKSPAHRRCEAAMETVMYVITVKVAEEKAAAVRAERKKEKEALLCALAERQAGKLSAMTEKELQRRIAALDAEE